MIDRCISEKPHKMQEIIITRKGCEVGLFLEVLGSLLVTQPEERQYRR